MTVSGTEDDHEVAGVCSSLALRLSTGIHPKINEILGKASPQYGYVRQASRNELYYAIIVSSSIDAVWPLFAFTCIVRAFALEF